MFLDFKGWRGSCGYDVGGGVQNGQERRLDIKVAAALVVRPDIVELL